MAAKKKESNISFYQQQQPEIRVTFPLVMTQDQRTKMHEMAKERGMTATELIFRLLDMESNKRTLLKKVQGKVPTQMDIFDMQDGIIQENKEALQKLK